jgi:hypothetical protein
LKAVGYDPDHDVGVFVLRLQCSSANCKESVACIGKYNCSLGCGSSGEPVINKALDPLFFFPTVPIFQLPAEMPVDIAEQLRQSFSLFWSNPNAAANSLRVAVEAMMDFHKVRKTTVNANGKRVPLMLHGRIVEFKKLNSDLGEKLMAIKWLGNSGSHLTGISKKRLYDGYRLVHYVMEEMFENKKRNLDKTIIRRKGRP